jgi:hypothetical protein
MAAKLKIEKKRDEIKKKSSPLKLVSQSQPNFAEMILFKFHPPFFLICIIGQNRQNSKFIKNPVIYVKKLIIMLIQFKFGHFLA